MQLVTYLYQNQRRSAALAHGRIVDLQRTYQIYGPARYKLQGLLNLPVSLLEFLRLGEPALQAAAESLAALQTDLSGNETDLRAHEVVFLPDEVHLCAPIPEPGKLICVGANYPAAGKPAPEYPVLFLKPSSSITGPGAPIILPELTRSVAYEVELAVIIGRRARGVSPAEAREYIAGYTLANDLGDRDLEKRTSQWTSGKLFDSFTPMGPALLTRDEVPDDGHLFLSTVLNGDIVQKGNTADMFFNVAALVSYISTLSTLMPGDIILTGSPKMMDGQPAPQVFLKKGDHLEIRIDILGCLENRVEAEGAGL
ncbi:MAG: fumarylacetoacetate hydrolase family protein [Anaerolineae bacterium]|nr:fumarylacetoacetate hydrolase family protein [Anaerolineae bacterium]